MAKTKDVYTQRLSVQLTLSVGADLFKYIALTSAYKPEDLIGFVLKEVRYNLETPLHTILDTDADRFKFGISFLQAHTAGGPEANDPGILDFWAFSRHDLYAGAADVIMIEKNPIAVRDYTNFDGDNGNDGLLVHPVNLFVFGYADTQLAALTLNVTVEYKVIDLTDALHKQLWQSIYIRQV